MGDFKKNAAIGLGGAALAAGAIAAGVYLKQGRNRERVLRGAKKGLKAISARVEGISDGQLLGQGVIAHKISKPRNRSKAKRL